VTPVGRYQIPLIMTEHLLTPSKITAWLDCGWYLTLKNGDRQVELNHPGPLAKLLMEKGQAHEDACLAAFDAQGLRIYRTPERETHESFDQWVARVGNPMVDDWDVIYQFPMIHDGMRGVADFLVRTPSPVDGYNSYEPYDAKLARTQAKPGHVLQLCFYADALKALTGQSPRQIHLWLGSGDVESLVVEQFGPYWRRLRRTLAEVIAAEDGVIANPEPCAHCDFCEFSQHCESIWRSADSLVYVAGIRKSEQRSLEAADITTIAKLADVSDAAPGVLAARQERLRQQAALQIVSRDNPDQPPAYWFIPPGDDPVWGHGYGELPEPDPGDVFFDLEGHPFWTAAAGLFFLFGLWYSVDGEWVYEARWAHNLEEQAAVAAGVVEFFGRRREQHPGFHVYHYNHTERSALAAMTLGTPSEAPFTLLSDTGLFVDLMTIAKNSFQVGVESYGLKSLEKLAGYQRQGDIEKGVGAVVDYESYVKSGDPTLLDAIAQYNKDDVCATQALLNWLLAHRPAEAAWRAAVIEEFEGDPELDRLAEQLLAFDTGTAEHRLGDLLGYWRRERLADVGPKFAQLEADTPVLLNDPDFVAGLEFLEFQDHQGARGELKYAVFSWPDQPLSNDIRDGTVLIAGGLGESGFAGLVDIDRDARTLTLRWNEKREEDGFFPRALSRDDWVMPRPKPAVLGQLARQVLEEPGEPEPNPVSMALISRALPRFLPNTGPPGGEFTDNLGEILAWVNDLDCSYVAIQGPPGTGKTYSGAHIIHALITAGKRVGISAMGHAAIDNLLKAVHDVFSEKNELSQLSACRRAKEPAGGGLGGVNYAAGNKAAANMKYNLVAGTSWFFSSQEMRNAPVDVLLIDEAGQLSLADAVAASSSANSVLLLGDPLQLAQVSKGTHPDASGASVLEHVLGDGATITADRGVFLSETRRMHPAVCGFISSQFYEGRLSSYLDCSDQRIDGVEAGLVWLRAVHAGRSTDSPEEAELVVATILELLGREWHDSHGKTAALAAKDFMVVAPYNDQVRLLRDVLDVDNRTAGVQVGTVDKFQGREAPVVFFTMTTSTGEDMPRGPEFLFSRNRLNVAVSRAQCVAYLVCTEELLNSRAKTVQDMCLIGTLSAFVEQARRGSVVH
jgi:predicted RecB family nuclease